MRALRLQEQTTSTAPVHEVGVLVRTESDHCVVQVESFGLRRAKRAASCLLEPEPGDRVLLSGADASEVWVIAVLERHGSGIRRLSLTGDTELSVRDGSLTLDGERGVALASAQAVAVSAREFSVAAESGTFVVGTARLIGRGAEVVVGHLKVIGEALESFVDRVVQHSRVSVRRIDEVERVEGGQIDYLARETLCLRGDTTLIGGRELIKADGKQIHLG